MAEKTAQNKEFTKEDLHSYIKSAVSKLCPNVSKEDKIKYAKLFLKIYEQGMAPKDAMEIKDEEIAQLYSFAFHQFSGGKYDKARDLFKMLFYLDPTNGDYVTSLGICHHRLREYESALYCYMLAAFGSPSPVSYFYAYDCCHNLNDDYGAIVMLCGVITRSGDDPQYAHVKQDAQIRLDALRKKIEERKADTETESYTRA